MSKVILLSDYKQTLSWLIAFLKDEGVRNIAYIMDAKKPHIKIDPEYKFKEPAIFEESGINVVIVELDVLRADTLQNALKDVDAIYVKGGNSFYLLNAMKKSGFDKLAPKLVNNGAVYIGESAGAYVACPNIEMAHWKHQDRDIVGMNDLTGLNLVPFLVSAHYTEELKSALEPYIEDNKLGVKLLRDNELIIYEDGKIKTIHV